MGHLKASFLSQRVSGVSLTSRNQQIKQLARNLERDGRDVVDLAIGEPCFDTPDNIKVAAKKALDDGFTHYTSNRGLEEVRDAFAEKLRSENGIPVDPRSELMLTNGAKLSLYLAMMATIDPGDEVLLLDPCFGAFAGITRLCGGVPVYAQCTREGGRFRPDLKVISDRVGPRTKAIVVNSPCNPTGTVFTRAEMEELAEVACRNDLLVFSDETYEKITFEGHEHLSMAALSRVVGERTITIGSLSKTYAMAGWRVGFLVAPPQIIEAASYLNQSSARMVTAFVQLAAREAILGDQKAVSNMILEYSERRTQIVEGLNSIDGVECLSPEGTFYVFLRVDQFGLSSFDFAQHLVLKGGVVSMPGNSYGPAGEGHIRLSFAAPPSAIHKAIDGIRKAIAELAT